MGVSSPQQMHQVETVNFHSVSLEETQEPLLLLGHGFKNMILYEQKPLERDHSPLYKTWFKLKTVHLDCIFSGARMMALMQAIFSASFSLRAVSEPHAPPPKKNNSPSSHSQEFLNFQK